MLYAKLIAFLHGRLDDDEHAARKVRTEDWQWFCSSGHLPLHVDRHGRRHNPARVLAEVNAKREIVDELTHKATRDNEDSASPEQWQATSTARWLLHCMAAVYSDHPEYPTLKGTDQ